MTKPWILTLIFAAAWFFAAYADAQVSAIKFVPVDNSSGGVYLADSVTTDITVSFAGQYTGARLIFDLTGGAIR